MLTRVLDVSDESFPISLNPCFASLEKAEGNGWIQVIPTQGACGDIGPTINSGESMTVTVLLGTSDTLLPRTLPPGTHRCVLPSIARSGTPGERSIASSSFLVAAPSS